MNLPLPTDVEWATSPHPFAIAHDEPGTAIDADAITPAQWEARWLARAREINLAFAPVPMKQRGRKGGGHPPRPTRTRADGVVELQCNKCLLYLPADCFYRRLKSRQPTCKHCASSRGGQQWRSWKDGRQAALCEQEQGT